MFSKYPAIIALRHQVIGVVLTAIYVAIWRYVFHEPVIVLSALLICGTLAAFFSWRTQQPRWWIPLHLVFPVAVVSAYALQIPPTLYLIAFLVCAAFYGSIHRTRVPYYPSRQAVWEQVVRSVPQHHANARVLEIGSGFGGFAGYVKKVKPAWSVSGIELALIPWLISRIRFMTNRAAPRIYFGDYTKHSFAGYDVLFAYLSPAAMSDLWDKAQRELAKDALLFSLEFPIDGVTPAATHAVAGKTLYEYRV